MVTAGIPDVTNNEWIYEPASKRMTVRHTTLRTCWKRTKKDLSSQCMNMLVHAFMVKLDSKKLKVPVPTFERAILQESLLMIFFGLFSVYFINWNPLCKPIIKMIKESGQWQLNFLAYQHYFGSSTRHIECTLCSIAGWSSICNSMMHSTNSLRRFIQGFL